MKHALIAVVALPMVALCQGPVISSVVNAASYQATPGTTGSLDTIFGTNLASTTATAQKFPLPSQLGGTSVTVGGVLAPLLYVSPSQINFQMPGFKTSDTNIVVATAAGSSASYDPFTAVPNAWYAAGLFSKDASGCGQFAVLNVAPDGGSR